MSTCVLVRGFDFGTSTDVIWSHCSSAGSIESVEMSGAGSAVAKFTTPAEANHAVNTLNRTTIPGNKRYIDVIFDLKAGEKRDTPVSGAEVFVRGFDFGTTDEQLEGHCGSVGQIVKVHWITKGSAVVHYSTPDEAAAAVSSLNATTIEGNSRYIDVSLDDGSDHRPAKKGKVAFDNGSAELWQKNANPWQLMMMSMMQRSNPWLQSGGKSEGKGKGNPKTKEDPSGSGRVYVRGFDFGTSADQLLSHMKNAGEVLDIHSVDNGSAIVVFETGAMAHAAVSGLHRTTIQGNSRYIDVIAKESE